MEPDDPSTSRARRRAAGLTLALLTTTALTLTGCGGSTPADTPAISGGNPADITVPTVPPTTADPTGTTVAGATTTAPAGG